MESVMHSRDAGMPREPARHAAAAASAQQLAALIDQLPAICWTTDRDLRFTSSSGAGLVALGLRPGQAVGQTLHDFFQDPDGTGPAIVMHRQALAGATVRYEQQWAARTYQVSVQPLREDAVVVGCIGLALDITDYVVAANQLRETGARLRSLIEHSPDAIFVESEDGRVLDVNPAGCRLHDCRREDLVGREIRELVPVWHLEEVAREFPRLLRGELERLESYSLTATGEAVPVELTVARITYADRPALQLHVRDIRKRRAAEAALRQSESSLRALASQLQRVREEESARIAREIHDELGQALTGIKFDTAWVARQLAQDQTPATIRVQQKLDELQQQLDETINTVRRISSELRPAVLDSLGLLPALEWQAREFTRRTGVSCRTQLPAAAPAWPGAQSTALFRIFQELLTNVARHASARCVTVRLALEGGEWLFEVRDDGRGIQPACEPEPAGLGLLGIRERALAFGGRLDIRSGAGDGTTVRVWLPTAALAATA